jgi:hypothetical protein
MPATGKITLDASDYKKTLEEVKAKTVTASDDMSKAVKKFGGDVGGAGKAVSALSSEVGSSFGQIGRVIGAVASGPVALLAAAFGALVVAGKYVFDSLTTSAEEYANKLDKTNQIEQRRYKDLVDIQSAEDGYLTRLNELSEKESLTNEEKTETLRLVDLLNTHYGDLGVVIDETTGKVINLAEAEKKVNAAQKEALEQSLRRQIENLQARANAEAQQHFVGSTAHQFGSWITGNLHSTYETARAWNAMTPEERERAANLALNSDQLNDAGQVDFYAKQANYANDLIDLQNRLNTLKEDGVETEKEIAGELKTQSEAAAAKAEAEKKSFEAAQKFFEAQRKAEQDAERRAEEAARRDLESMKREENARRKEQQSYRSTALKSAGYGARAAREEAILAAEQKNGGPLDSEQYSKAVRFANAKFRLENFQFNAPQDFAPRVNSLVARGGSDAPVSMPKIEDLQAQTLNNVKTIKDLAVRFLSAAEDWGTF